MIGYFSQSCARLACPRRGLPSGLSLRVEDGRTLGPSGARAARLPRKARALAKRSEADGHKRAGGGQTVSDTNSNLRNTQACLPAPRNACLMKFRFGGRAWTLTRTQDTHLRKQQFEIDPIIYRHVSFQIQFSDQEVS
jgi:hypothetical protein